MSRFEQYVVKGGVPLRMGYTTGSCAAIASGAATKMLINGEALDRYLLYTPSGQALDLDIVDINIETDFVSCAVKKFSGDDPDSTDGILVYATVRKQSEGIYVTGGKGVGVVTKTGLPVEVGKSAINPVPMQMIQDEVKRQISEANYNGGLHVEISIPEGERLAARTYNPRLGIEGGLSILGTRGILEPMSNKAIVDTFKLQLDAFKKRGRKSVLIVPGNYGADFIYTKYGLGEEDAVQCSNFIGEALDYIRYLEFDNMLLAGHCGKLVKLAAGVMNTHSSTADARMEVIVTHIALVAGITPQQAKIIMGCTTVPDANRHLRSWGIFKQVWQSIGNLVYRHMEYRLAGKIPFGFIIFEPGEILVQRGEVDSILKVIGEKA